MSGEKNRVKTLFGKKKVGKKFRWGKILSLAKNLVTFPRLFFPDKVTSIYCVGWFGKIILNKVIIDKQILIVEDTCWKFGGDEVPGGNECLGERLSFELKSERWDLITGERSKFDDGRGKLVTFSCFR